jgi:hypothetical protein
MDTTEAALRLTLVWSDELVPIRQSTMEGKGQR